MYEFKQFHIPSRMMQGIDRYINQGIRPGGFLTAVFSNDFCLAVGTADSENLENIMAFVGYLHNEAPSACYGSKEKMKAWLNKFNGELK